MGPAAAPASDAVGFPPSLHKRDDDVPLPSSPSPPPPPSHPHADTPGPGPARPGGSSMIRHAQEPAHRKVDLTSRNFEYKRTKPMASPQRHGFSPKGVEIRSDQSPDSSETPRQHRPSRRPGASPSPRTRRTAAPAPPSIRRSPPLPRQVGHQGRCARVG